MPVRGPPGIRVEKGSGKEAAVRIYRVGALPLLTRRAE